eukprot:7305249-Alexandrium_andersonii.AAC.1
MPAKRQRQRLGHLRAGRPPRPARGPTAAAPRPSTRRWAGPTSGRRPRPSGRRRCLPTDALGPGPTGPTGRALQPWRPAGGP